MAKFKATQMKKILLQSDNLIFQGCQSQKHYFTK